MLNEVIKRANSKATSVSGPKNLGLTRAVKKWSRIAEELENHMMKMTSSTSINSMGRKRRLDLASTLIDTQQRQQRRVDESSFDKNYKLDKAIIALVKRHSMGLAMDEVILDQLLSSLNHQQRNDNKTLDTKELGTLLIEHPFAIDALMHALYLPGGRIKSTNIKTKCAKLVAIAVIASEKKVIETLDNDDKSDGWIQELQNQSIDDVDHIANVRNYFLFAFSIR